jgi:predicted acetylornithine/succinylornithine family transaminase
MPTYRRYPVTLVRGEGTRVFDDAGRSYLDFAGGIACVPIGHSHPRWVAAVREQVGTLTHVSNLYATLPQQELASRLVGLAGEGFGRVFFCNSGAEANEAALKLARLRGRPLGKTKVVALAGSFHGRTFATLAATGQPDKHGPFHPLPEGFVHVEPEDAAALRAAVDDETAAVLLEPVLGEGGVVPLSDGFLREARDVCDERGALLLFDEVQTGVGRCGTWFAFQGNEIRPDVFTLAKGLAGGLPIGAVVAAEPFAFGPGDHASTFGGGPVPCVGALAVLDVIEDEELLSRAAAMGERLRTTLGEVLEQAGRAERPRGRGLLVGAPLGPAEGPGAVRASAVILALLRRGFLATEAGGNVVRCTPALTVDAGEIDAFASAFADALVEASHPATQGGAP